MIAQIESTPVYLNCRAVVVTDTFVSSSGKTPLGVTSMLRLALEDLGGINEKVALLKVFVQSCDPQAIDKAELAAITEKLY